VIEKRYPLKHYLSPGAAASSAILRQRPRRARSYIRPRWPALMHRWRNTPYPQSLAVFRQPVTPEGQIQSSVFPANDGARDARAFPVDPAPDFTKLDVGVLVQICAASDASNGVGALSDGSRVAAGNDDGNVQPELPVANAGGSP
jgi:hypothetical protein